MGLGINKIISLLILPIFTAYLSPSDYGVIGILAFISFFVTPIFGLGVGISIGIVYFEEDNQARKDQTIWMAFILLLISSILLLSGTLIFIPKIGRWMFKNSEYNYLVILSVLTSIFNSFLTQPFVTRLQFENKARQYTSLFIIANIVTIALSLFFVIILKRGLLGWIEAGLIGGIVTFIIFFLPSLRLTRVALVKKVGWELFILGIPLIPSFFLLFIIQHSSRYLLQYFYGLQEVGRYTIGYNLGFAMNLAITSFTTAWYPYFNSFVNKQEEAKPIFSRILTYYVYGFGILVLCFFLFAKFVVTVLTKPQFYEAYKVVGWIALSQFFIGVFSIMVPGMYFNKKTKIVNLVQGLSAILTMGICFLLVRNLGLVGAALATAAGLASMPVFQYLFNNLNNFLKIKYEWMRIAKIFIVLAAIIFYAQQISQFGIVLNLILAVLGLLSALIMVWLLLEQSEKEFIKNKVLLR